MDAALFVDLIVQATLFAYPNVRLRLHQGNPMQVSEMVTSGLAELAIATENIANNKELISFPCQEWQHVVVTPNGHPLLREENLSLEALACYPLITYDAVFAGRSKIDRAFSAVGLSTNVVLTAIDADVIKTYVEMGLGVGIMAEMAFNPMRDKGLHAIPAGMLFGSNTTRIGVKRGTYLMGYIYDFIEMFAPNITHKQIKIALLGEE